MDSARHDEALDALGDANRRAIVEILREGGHSVQEISDQLPISRPAVSRHLRLLKQAGLVSDEAHGTRHIYALRDDGVEAIRRYFEETWGHAVARYRIVAENSPRKRK
jgi:DNA-binding transcriptional ArsR family regulator